MSQLSVVEAKDGDILQPGTCYIAPGGMQMIFERAGTSARVRILKDNGRVSYNPCVDVSFASLSQIYGGRILAMILTGMGSDGCEGCRLMKQKGSIIWAQNEDTCVVYGMPQAIVNAGIADLVLPLDEIAEDITKEF
jgi:two-component system chemotaxis response regulator CheB